MHVVYVSCSSKQLKKPWLVTMSTTTISSLRLRIWSDDTHQPTRSFAMELDKVVKQTGWRNSKEEMKKLADVSNENYKHELKISVVHRLLLGYPGMIRHAGYYGRVLETLHFFSNGELVKKTVPLSVSVRESATD